MMDILQAKYIALGVVFDDACFRPENGKISYVYGDLDGKSWYKTHYFDDIASVGVDIIWPFVGVSEAITTEITKKGKHGHLVSSCHFSDGKQCGKCVKCLRKSEVDLRQMDKVLKSFWTRPKMAPTMIHALKKYSKEYAHIDTSFVWEIHKHLIEMWNPEQVANQIMALPYKVVDHDEKINKFVKQFNAL